MWSLVAAVGLSSTACRKRHAREEEAPPPVETAGPSARIPVDRTLPGELAEGTEKAFGLILPRQVQVTARFDDLVIAATDVPPSSVAIYMRDRIRADKTEASPSGITFSRATIKAEPGITYTIQVLSHAGKTEITVRNTTTPKVKAGLTPEERWRELGYRPDGTPLDPTHLQ